MDRFRHNQDAQGMLRARRLAAALAVLIWGGVGSVLAAEPAAGTYRVIDGKVDHGTFNGWLVFHTACFMCHGRDALGTDIAPSLVTGVKDMSVKEFSSKVLTRYRITIGSSEANADNQAAMRDAIMAEVMRAERGRKGTVSMPAWQSNTGVEAHLLDLYAYLKARADGALPSGRPGVSDK